MTTGWCFPLQLVPKRDETVFVHIDKQKKRKRKYISLFIKYLQTVFLRGTQPLQCDAQLCQSDVIAKRSHYKMTSLFLIFNSLARNTIIIFFSIRTGNIALSHRTYLGSSVSIQTPSNISQYRSKNSYYYLFMKRTCN